MTAAWKVGQPPPESSTSMFIAERFFLDSIRISLNDGSWWLNQREIIRSIQSSLLLFESEDSTYLSSNFITIDDVSWTPPYRFVASSLRRNMTKALANTAPMNRVAIWKGLSNLPMTKSDQRTKHPTKNLLLTGTVLPPFRVIDDCINCVEIAITDVYEWHSEDQNSSLYKIAYKRSKNLYQLKNYNRKICHRPSVTGWLTQTPGSIDWKWKMIKRGSYNFFSFLQCKTENTCF